MSDDYSDSSNGPSSSGEPAPQIANAALRIAVTSRSAEAARKIWHEIRRRVVKRGEFIAILTSGPGASVAVFHLTGEDLASEEAARTSSEAISRAIAPLNFLVCSSLKDDSEVRRRLDNLLSDLSKRNRFLKAPVSKEGDGKGGEEEELLSQARGLANLLLNDPPPLSSVSLSEFAANEKEAKREAKAVKKSSKRDGGEESVSVAPVKKMERKKIARAGPSESREPRRANKPARDEKRKESGGNGKAERESVAQAVAVAQPVQREKKDKSAKKAVHAAEREKRRAEKRAVAGSEPAEGKKKDKSAKKAAHAAAKAVHAAEREKRKAEKRAAAPEVVESEKKDKTAKKAQHAAAKAAHAAEREKRRAEKLAASGGNAEKHEKKDKSAIKAERKARKAATEEPGLVAAGDGPREKREKQKKEPPTEAQKLERKEARAAEKEARKKNRQSGGIKAEGDDDSSRALRISLKGIGEAASGELRLALEHYLDGTPVEWPQPEKKADITIYGFDDLPLTAAEFQSEAARTAEDTTRLRIFLERGAPGTNDGQKSLAVESCAIARLAGAFESPVIKLQSKLARYDAGAASASDILATSILGIASGGRLPKHKIPRPAPPPPSDLVEARTLAATPREFLEQMTWNDARAPRLLWTHASKESAEALLDHKVVLSEEQTLDITVPITWPDDASGRSVTAGLFGLEFLSGPLNYWYSKANGRDSTKVAEVDAVIKQRGATASQILSQAGAIIVDFVSKHPLSASIVWEENAVSRRARVLALYLLCCRMAVKRKIKFDEAVCTEAIRGLLDLVEVLRSEDFYTPCSFDGVQQDCLLVGLALVLRNTAYSQRLMRESLDRLVSCQIEPGLTADGVWRTGTFSDHCSLLAQFRIMLSDFDRNDAAILEPVAGAAKKMTVFAEAMQKSNGSAPSFDDSSEKSFARKLSGTRRALAGAGFAKSAPQRKVVPPRMTDTYVFRDAQYFVSHSTLKVVPESSLVVLHAAPVSFARSNPGGVTLAFAYGASDLLIRAEPPEGASRRDKEPGFDPALRNGYHVNGTGYVSGTPVRANAARLEKSWRGTGWAAARSVDEINPAGSIARTVLHLKAEHALIVVDELLATDGQEATFEQFWHVAPGLTPPALGAAPYRFDLAGNGGLTVVFDAPANATVEAEGEGHCIRHAVSVANGIAVSAFQWSAQPGTFSFEKKGRPGDWMVNISGSSFTGKVNLAAGELRYTPGAV